jgi:hypothetical protein
LEEITSLWKLALIPNITALVTSDSHCSFLSRLVYPTLPLQLAHPLVTVISLVHIADAVADLELNGRRAAGQKLKDPIAILSDLLTSEPMAEASTANAFDYFAF